MDDIIGYFWICSSHFDQNQIETRNGRTTISCGSIPSKFETPRRDSSEICSPPIPAASLVAVDNQGHLAERLNNSSKIQALERENAALKGKMRLLTAKSVAMKKSYAVLEKTSKSQEQKILALEKKIEEMLMPELLFGVRIVSKKCGM